jgi:hypothetical protein
MKDDKDRKKAAMAELNALVKANGGRITPEALVQAASNKKSALHDFFEWDDATAAHQYRLEQARRMIRSCRIVEIVHKEKLEVPYLIRDPQADSSEQGYIETGRVATEEDLARDSILSEITKARGNLVRVSSLSKYFDLGNEIDDLIDRLDAIHRRVQRPLDIAV